MTTTKLPDMGKMVGPLPLGAWLAVVGSSFGFMVYQRRQADIVPSDAATDSGTADSDPSSGDYNTIGNGAVGGWVPTAPVTGTDDDVAPDIATNEQWGTSAIRWLIAQGYNPAVADSAIRKYLDQSKKYSSQEYAMVTFALGHFGPTPTPLPAPVYGQPATPIVPKPKPPKPPAPKPVGTTPKPRVRHYVVKAGDTLSGIGRKFGIPWQHIYAANKHLIHDPNQLHVGWRLIIPKS